MRPFYARRAGRIRTRTGIAPVRIRPVDAVQLVAWTRYTAVVTTGIYCRPGCRGTPLPPQHAAVRVTPAAAEAAGFRPCLRCRPDREPDAGLDRRARARLPRDATASPTARSTTRPRTTSPTRLGVSARHLRRLFDEHVGATPSEVARSRRAHFARRLLDDTDLPIAAGRDRGRLQQRAPDEPRHEGGLPVHAAASCAPSAGSPTGSSPTAGSSCACPTGRRSRGTRCSRSSRRARSPASRPSTSTRACTGASSTLDGAPGVIEVWDVPARAGAAAARAPARRRRPRAPRRGRAAPVRPRRRSRRSIDATSRATERLRPLVRARARAARPGRARPVRARRARDPRPAGVGRGARPRSRARSSSAYGRPVPRPRRRSASRTCSRRRGRLAARRPRRHRAHRRARRRPRRASRPPSRAATSCSTAARGLDETVRRAVRAARHRRLDRAATSRCGPAASATRSRPSDLGAARSALGRRRRRPRPRRGGRGGPTAAMHVWAADAARPTRSATDVSPDHSAFAQVRRQYSGLRTRCRIRYDCRTGSGRDPFDPSRLSRFPIPAQLPRAARGTTDPASDVLTRRARPGCSIRPI